MESLNYFKYQLQYFTELREKCAHKETIRKIDRAISTYKSLVNNYDIVSHSVSEECHCPTCAMQG